MRMPLFSYFIVVGATLTLALLYISDRVEPEKAVPGLGIGNLSESQTLHRVKDPAIHDEAMRS